ncbi:MAG: dihydrofolate reductase family protein [Dermatophilaceae bacterium]
MRLLLSPPDGLFHAPMDNLSNEAFASVYAIASHRDRWVRASMVSTVDGSAVGADGLSGSINTPADHIAFKVNRALSDLVFVGAGTVRTEGYTPLQPPAELAHVRQAAGLPAHLSIAVVTAQSALPDTFTQTDDRPVYMVTTELNPHRQNGITRLGAQQVITAGESRVDLPEALHQIGAQGFSRILAEGGPTLLGQLVALDLVDELALTLVPTVVGGDHPRILSGDSLTAHFAPHVILEHDGTLLGRWLAARHTPAGSSLEGTS